ncbi:MAG: transcriptional regulator, XRE family [Candidatus Parvarchaeum acidiphilum ARMAN-4]|jgi:putative transcription factor|uniref:Transcriptional regulator, XRE family n=1 Tax=Candidatus Parvarchaeum acidiphilum ARMAN-4 TaxID=662760 RepID=D2EFR1_PARA4|nr:MAG: transcriptional regulator, XRE family [Candidatus Parvarchaeum acidiphilum ARMAN-4]
MNCEICGAFEENLLKVEVEGALMNLCKSCSKYGKVIEFNTSTNNKQLKQYKSERQLKYNYLEVMKNALEEKKLSINEVANNLKCSPKDLKKIFLGDILPDNDITAKIEKVLNISLYELDYVSDVNSAIDSNKLSFGDVVDIKRIKK